ncbi:MAG: CBS domain-containing protein [Deltaproteobacteria bacterium]|nr:CBS domain-containing protein [Deltaproteobacteria bacterium]
MDASEFLVGDYMSDLVDWVPEGALLPQVRERLEDLDVSALAVLDAAGEPVGVVSRTDLLSAGRLDREPRDGESRRLLTIPDLRVTEVMAAPVATIPTTANLAEAARRLVEARVHRLFVTEDDRTVGVLSTFDLAQATIDARLTTPLSELMTPDVVVVAADEPLSTALDRMQAAHVHGVVVVDQGWPIGVFGQADVLAMGAVKADAPVEEWMDVAVLCLPKEMSAHRAAAAALAMDVEQVLVMDAEGVVGIVTAMDFARGLADAS